MEAIIIQNFLNVNKIMNSIMDNCFDKDFHDYFAATMKIEFHIIDQTLEELEDSMVQTMDRLATLAVEDIYNCIKALTTKEKYFLYECFSIAAYFEKTHVQYLPLFPLEKLYFNFFAYLQFCYFTFKKHCADRHISISSAIMDLVLDNILPEST